MPCPVCLQAISETGHRFCVLDLLKSGKIKSSSEWENMCKDKPMTIRKGKVRAILPKD